ncbi:sigma-70 family RNA polymerase sigma factor [Telmatocola sphagniphila]|uniref:Sigma-70 family RNA polymerase sigma factor n=1 Tax=Telmatocola sphagniphila TaxID=1123043 RepID=A0A8E6EWS8_9BACT|nr:sigma-70 family RNA polymerase sigma factor [Telmatocola sphagniphila]QVL34102.1 sigma-70 family RNA polymerase sigma factor [Telmatocola sphagniphila]
MSVVWSGSELLKRRLLEGDPRASLELFEYYRSRLRRMVRLRLDHRLQGRLDPSDVLQEACVDVVRRAPQYASNPTMPPYLWLRFLTGQRLLALHRKHLGAKMRDAGQEIPLHSGLPPASSASLAADVLGSTSTPSHAAIRLERQIFLQEALNLMPPLDREILTLRHFEELSNNETAHLLGIQKAAASNRYMRALKRLKEILATHPEVFKE